MRGGVKSEGETKVFTADRVKLMQGTMRARYATSTDADAVVAIYNEGIADGIATFETRLRTADDVKEWFGGRFPAVVVENDAGAVIAFASTSSRTRPAARCCAGWAFAKSASTNGTDSSTAGGTMWSLSSGCWNRSSSVIYWLTRCAGPTVWSRS
jgi:hypothetical protein